MRASAIIVAAALLLAGCPSPDTRVTGERRTLGVVTMTLRIEPTQLRVGEAVQMRIRLVNNSGQAETLEFPSGKRYDFWVLEDGEEVWRWSDGQMFTQAAESIMLEGQTGRSFAESWSPGTPGTYQIRGALTAEGYDQTLEGEVRVE